MPIGAILFKSSFIMEWLLTYAPTYSEERNYKLACKRVYIIIWK